jgi:hypothetical protein
VGSDRPSLAASADVTMSVVVQWGQYRVAVKGLVYQSI